MDLITLIVDLDPITEDWLKEHGYYIDVRDRASVIAMKGYFVSIGRFHSFKQACEAVIKYHSERR